jgi:ubiquinone/menaquinone biosynthesis C-methylase UbiE
MNNKKLTNKEVNEISHFNKLANKYDSNYNYNDEFTKYKIDKKIKEFTNFVNQNINDKKFKIVELGCGTGEYTKLMAENFPNATIEALDISDGILQIAKKKCKKYKNIKFISTSAYKLPMKKDSTHVVCGFYFLHHVDVKKVGNEVSRILKKTGVGFFYEPNILNPFVYLIKSNRTLKSIVGDSPDEWAINPITVAKYFNKFKVETSTSEFVLPLANISFSLKRKLDEITSVFTKIPILNFFGGSVAIKLYK